MASDIVTKRERMVEAGFEWETLELEGNLSSQTQWQRILIRLISNSTAILWLLIINDQERTNIRIEQGILLFVGYSAWETEKLKENSV